MTPKNNIGWQKIETALKDGTEVDVWIHDRKWGSGYRCADAWYDVNRNAWFHRGEYGDCEEINPTHWMPIPHPPEQE